MSFKIIQCSFSFLKIREQLLRSEHWQRVEQINQHLLLLPIIIRTTTTITSIQRIIITNAVS